MQLSRSCHAGPWLHMKLHGVLAVYRRNLGARKQCMTKALCLLSVHGSHLATDTGLTRMFLKRRPRVGMPPVKEQLCCVDVWKWNQDREVTVTLLHHATGI
jgi:hypothetical protein